MSTIYFILGTNPEARYFYYSPFTFGETEVQGDTRIYSCTK